MHSQYVAVNRLGKVDAFNADIKNSLHTAAVCRETINVLADDTGGWRIYRGSKNQYRKKADNYSRHGNLHEPPLRTIFLHNNVLYTLSDIVTKLVLMPCLAVTVVGTWKVYFRRINRAATGYRNNRCQC